MRTLQRGSPYVLLVLIALLAGAQLAATLRVGTFLEMRERQRDASAPLQNGYTLWIDADGMENKITTPRRPGESEAAWRRRHQVAVDFFSGTTSEE